MTTTAQELIQETRRDYLREFLRQNELLLEGRGLYDEDGLDNLLLVAGWLDDPSEQSEPFAHCPRYAAVYSYEPDGYGLSCITQVALRETPEASCRRLEEVIDDGYEAEYLIDLDTNQRLEVKVQISCTVVPSS